MRYLKEISDGCAGDPDFGATTTAVAGVNYARRERGLSSATLKEPTRTQATRPRGVAILLSLSGGSSPIVGDRK